MFKKLIKIKIYVLHFSLNGMTALNFSKRLSETQINSTLKCQNRRKKGNYFFATTTYFIVF